jgi:hypothetical protein
MIGLLLLNTTGTTPKKTTLDAWNRMLNQKIETRLSFVIKHSWARTCGLASFVHMHMLCMCAYAHTCKFASQGAVDRASFCLGLLISKKIKILCYIESLDICIKY